MRPLARGRLRRCARWLVAGLALVFCAGLLSCAAYRVAAVDERLDDRTASPRRVQVTGYTTTDGRYHRFEGYLRTAGDSITLIAPARRSQGLSVGTPERMVTLARSQVASVKLQDGTDVPRSVLLAIGVLVFVALLGFAAAVQGQDLGPL
jgi:hypothetical protein